MTPNLINLSLNSDTLYDYHLAQLVVTQKICNNIRYVNYKPPRINMKQYLTLFYYIRPHSYSFFNNFLIINTLLFYSM